jgi:hypothetical protein
VTAVVEGGQVGVLDLLNTEADPGFVDAAHDDFHTTNPCRGIGRPLRPAAVRSTFAREPASARMCRHGRRVA